MEIQLSSILIQFLNFGIVVFIIAKFVYKPVIKILKQRTERIEKGQLDSEKASKLGEEAQDQANAKISAAKKEADSIIARAKKDSQKQAAEIIATAKVQAKKQAETERVNMLASLEEEKKSVLENLASLVTSATAQVLQNGLSEEQQHQLIASQIKSLKGVALE